MVVSLFEKYGVVPKSVYPESISSSNSRELNTYLNKLLRQDAQILRELLASGADQVTVQSKKEELLQEIFNFLAMSLGLPPRTFSFSYRDKDNNFHTESGLTPQVFTKNMWIFSWRTTFLLSMRQRQTSLMASPIRLRCWGMWSVAGKFATSTFRWSA